MQDFLHLFAIKSITFLTAQRLDCLLNVFVARDVCGWCNTSV